MADRELIVLFPCHGWEDFPIQLRGDEADGLLAAWSALWHPGLLVAAGSMPRWYRADAPPDAPAGSLIVVPRVSEAKVPEGWIDRAADQNAVVLRGLGTREELLAAAADCWQIAGESTDSDLAADFLAFGSCYLVVKLLGREMYTASYLDESQLQNRLADAAAAAVAGDQEAARLGLAKMYDLLVQHRDHYSPIEAYLIDLTLVAATTLGPSLRDELRHAAQKTTPLNLVISGELVDRMASAEPETLRVVREALERGNAELVGGEYTDHALPLHSPEELLAELERGRAAYQKHLGQVASIFGRRTFGLSPMLPQVLSGSGFRGSLHTALDGEPIPVSRQVKVRWEGLNGSTMDALAATALDASKPESFLRLARMMGQSMHRDYVATVCYAHWPGQRSIWYEDLRRIASYSPVLGRFVRLSDYFSAGVPPDSPTRFDPDQYGSPYLSLAVAAGELDPISRHVRHEAQQWELRLDEMAAALASLARGHLINTNGGERRNGIHEFAQAVGSEERDDAEGWLIVNPFSFGRSMPFEVTSQSTIAPQRASAVGSNLAAGKRRELVHVPAMGYTWHGGAAEQAHVGTQRSSQRGIELAEDHLLRNEFFEVQINPRTGGIEAIRSHDVRGNRLAQQVAMRLGTTGATAYASAADHDGSLEYSVMIADRIEVTIADAVLGEITSHGRLVDHQGQFLATFRQSVQVARQSRVLRLEIALAPTQPPAGDPWKCYYTTRFAWKDETAHMWRSVGMTRQPTEAMRFDAPHFVEVGRDERRITILTGGLAFHQRSGSRMLDTLLVVPGETARTFRLGIGVDLAHPLPSALELVAPREPLAVPASCPRGAPAGWLLHVDAKNVVVTHCEPLVETQPPGDGAQASRPSGTSSAPGQQVCGFRIRLLETEGRAGRTFLSSFRNIASAKKTDLCGEHLAELPLDGGRVAIHVGKYEWLQIEAKWSGAGS